MLFGFLMVIFPSNLLPFFSSYPFSNFLIIAHFVVYIMRLSPKPSFACKFSWAFIFPSLVAFLVSISTPVSATCYWPNSTLYANNPDSSTVSADDHPCNPNADASVCCGTGWTCLSDGVCKIHLKEADYYYRGTCTDYTWKSKECPGFCFQSSRFPLRANASKEPAHPDHFYTDNHTTEPLGKCSTSGADW